jgi:hypothetical protein
MKQNDFLPGFVLATAAFLLAAGMSVGTASATSPCGDFGECKALAEINSSDGDIGFHFLKDGDDLIATHIDDPMGRKIFQDAAKGALVDQKYTEVFAESAEPLCWADPEADPDEEIVTLEEFVERWPAGNYTFFGRGKAGETAVGQTAFTHALPAAPKDVYYDDGTGVISWTRGDDLGNCATNEELTALVEASVLPIHPEEVPVSVWEIVFEPESGPPAKFTVRIGENPLFNALSVTVPADFRDAFDNDTPGKIEVGAIGEDDNATFTEVEICINVEEGCDE